MRKDIINVLTLDKWSAFRSSYSLVVRASDLGNPSKSNTTRVRVTLTDVNDNDPRFPSAR